MDIVVRPIRITSGTSLANNQENPKSGVQGTNQVKTSVTPYPQRCTLKTYIMLMFLLFEALLCF